MGSNCCIPCLVLLPTKNIDLRGGVKTETERESLSAHVHECALNVATFSSLQCTFKHPHITCIQIHIQPNRLALQRLSYLETDIWPKQNVKAVHTCLWMHTCSECAFILLQCVFECLLHSALRHSVMWVTSSLTTLTYQGGLIRFGPWRNA